MNLTIAEERRLSKWLSDNKDEYPILDFSDWRVVGRVVEKLGEVDVYKWGEGWRSYVGDHTNGSARVGEGETPQEAIIRAALSYIGENNGD